MRYLVGNGFRLLWAQRKRRLQRGRRSLRRSIRDRRRLPTTCFPEGSKRSRLRRRKLCDCLMLITGRGLPTAVLFILAVAAATSQSGRSHLPPSRSELWSQRRRCCSLLCRCSSRSHHHSENSLSQMVQLLLDSTLRYQVYKQRWI